MNDDTDDNILQEAPDAPEEAAEHSRNTIFNSPAQCACTEYAGVTEVEDSWTANDRRCRALEAAINFVDPYDDKATKKVLAGAKKFEAFLKGDLS